VYHKYIAIRAVWRESSPARTAEGATGPETLRPMYDSFSRSLESDPARKARIHRRGTARRKRARSLRS
jgi:hypothetical protein